MYFIDKACPALKLASFSGPQKTKQVLLHNFSQDYRATFTKKKRDSKQRLKHANTILKGFSNVMNIVSIPMKINI